MLVRFYEKDEDPRGNCATDDGCRWPAHSYDPRILSIVELICTHRIVQMLFVIDCCYCLLNLLSLIKSVCDVVCHYSTTDEMYLDCSVPFKD